MADFIFADDYRLEEGATRSFYEEFLKEIGALCLEHAVRVDA